jgi:hypothetical protein
MANPKVKIKIDEDKVHVGAGIHSVTDIKALTTPPVPADHMLWIDVNGGPNIEVQNEGAIDVVGDMVLYSVGPDGAHPKHVDIVVDTKAVVSENESVTGAIIRRLVSPAIGPERDLYRDIEGAPDEKIEDDEVVTLTKGAEFYSVPTVIAPGRS